MCIRDSPSFEFGLYPFVLRYGISDDAPARLQVTRAPFSKQRAYGNREIHVAVVRKVADCTGVRSPPDRFKFLNNLHSPDFRRARHCASRKRGAQDVKTVSVIALSPYHLRDDVLHVAVALDVHKRRNVHAARLSLIHISEPTRQAEISYAVFCLKKKKNKK